MVSNENKVAARYLAYPKDAVDGGENITGIVKVNHDGFTEQTLIDAIKQDIQLTLAGEKEDPDRDIKLLNGKKYTVSLTK